MKYILDFDEVLFNTTALKAKLAEAGCSEAERSLEVFDRIQECDHDFDFTSLVFPGALKFLTEHGDDCIVVSSATSSTTENNTDLTKQLAYQTKKIDLSGVSDLVSAVHVVNVSKSEILFKIKEQAEAVGEDVVFMDDRQVYVTQALELGITSILIDRTCPIDAPSQNFPCIGSFAEFAQWVDSLKK